jgi:hypothetical protein
MSVFTFKKTRHSDGVSPMVNNAFCGITRKVSSGKYLSGIYWIFTDDYRIIHISKRRPIHKWVLTALGLIVNLIMLLPYLVFGLLSCYLQGAKNFITDSIWSNNVLFFGWTNMVLIAVLSVWLALTG